MWESRAPGLPIGLLNLGLCNGKSYSSGAGDVNLSFSKEALGDWQIPHFPLASFYCSAQ